jgi:branched-subunit amino acid transport protein
MTKYNNIEIWLIIITGGILTYLIRLSFIKFANEDFINRAKEFLSFMPASIFAAIVVSGIFSNGIKDVSFENYKIYASIVALLIALKFKNAIITILSGLIVVWTLTYFL